MTLSVSSNPTSTEKATDDELIAAARYEVSEDRRLAAIMRQPKNRRVLEQRALVTERLADRLVELLALSGVPGVL